MMPRRFLSFIGMLSLVVAAPVGQVRAACPVGLDTRAMAAPGQLVMATNPSLPPLQYMRIDGHLHGMRIELGTEIARRLCLRPTYISTAFSTMILGLMERRWDVVDTGMFYNHERASMLELIPYEIQSISVSMADTDTRHVTSVMDMAGMAVGVELGGFEEQRTRDIDRQLRAAGLRGLDIHTFDDFSVAFMALRAGQVAAVTSIDAVANRMAQEGGLHPVLSGLFPTPVVLAMHDHALATAIASIVNDMRTDGTLARIMQPYGIHPPPGEIRLYGPQTAATNP